MRWTADAVQSLKLQIRWVLWCKERDQEASFKSVNPMPLGWGKETCGILLLMALAAKFIAKAQDYDMTLILYFEFVPNKISTQDFPNQSFK